MNILNNNSALTKVFDYSLLFLFILSFSNPYLKKNIEYAIYLLIFFSFLNIKFYKLSRTDFQALFIVLFFISFEFIHAFIFSLDNHKTTIRVFSYFTVSYFVVKILRHKFLVYFINIIVSLSIISLLFYVIAYAMPSIYKSLYSIAEVMFPLDLDLNNYRTPTFIVYTFDPGYYSGNNILRNPGFAWESGGMATYINVALVFNLMNALPRSFSQFFADWRNKILLITIVTTFSTSGYVTLFVVLLIYFFSRLTLSNLLFVLVFISLAIYLYFNLDFLGQKINDQLAEASYSQNRFGAALLDWEEISKRPVFGWSRDVSVLFKTKEYVYEMHRPNGLTNFLRSYGLIYVISYITLIYFSMKNYAKSYRLTNYKVFSTLILTVVILMAFSQLVIHTLFTMSLLFFGIVSKDNRTLIK